MDLTLIILLAGLVLSAAICVTIRNLLKAAIALAAVSAILSIIMFVLGASLAAVFELSVCAGLITVVFISAISMTKILTKEEIEQKVKERRKRFVYLPAMLIIVLAAVLFFVWPHVNAMIPYAANSTQTAQTEIWGKRQVDLLGQIVIIIAGVYGVIVFFKESDEE